MVDGFRGGTGKSTRTGIMLVFPSRLALASVDQRLRDEGIRNNVSLVVGGNIRSAADVVKAIALGADACYLVTPLLFGRHLCRTCQSGKCNWGIATQRPELVKRLNPEMERTPDESYDRMETRNQKELMGGMGINSHRGLRGNRLMPWHWSDRKRA